MNAFSVCCISTIFITKLSNHSNAITSSIIFVIIKLNDYLCPNRP